MGGAEQTVPHPGERDDVRRRPVGAGDADHDDRHRQQHGRRPTLDLHRRPPSQAIAGAILHQAPRRTGGRARPKVAPAPLPVRYDSPMSESPPFAGIASFFKAPYIADPTSGRRRRRRPRHPLRRGDDRRGPERATGRAPCATPPPSGPTATAPTPFYDGEAGAELLGGVRFVDAGDVDLPPTAPPERNHPRIAARVRRLLDAGLFPVVLGGDHSITYPMLKASSQRATAPLHLVQFDTHMDYWNDEGGMLLHARQPHHPRARGRPRRRASPSTASAACTPPPTTSSWPASAACASSGASRPSATPVDELVAHIEPGEDVYITFDIDALDPSIAPGTGTPEPGGFSYYEAKAHPARRRPAGERHRHGRGRGQSRSTIPGAHRAARGAADLRHGRRRALSALAATRRRRACTARRRSAAM